MLASPEILSLVLTKLGHRFVIVQAEVSFLPEQGRQAERSLCSRWEQCTSFASDERARDADLSYHCLRSRDR